MRVNLRSTFAILALASAVFGLSLFGQAAAKREGAARAQSLWKTVGAACLPIMIITLAYGSLGLVDRHREQRRQR